MKSTQSICAVQLGGEPGCRQAAVNNRAPSATTALDFIPSLNAKSHHRVTAQARLRFGYLSPSGTQGPRATVAASSIRTADWHLPRPEGPLRFPGAPA